jgi:Xaa-Pro aminopeptidase
MAYSMFCINICARSGEAHLDKISRLREELSKKKAKGIVVTMLDEIAWLFNLRGSDVEYNPGT